MIPMNLVNNLYLVFDFCLSTTKIKIRLKLSLIFFLCLSYKLDVHLVKIVWHKQHNRPAL